MDITVRRPNLCADVPEFPSYQGLASTPLQRRRKAVLGGCDYDLAGVAHVLAGENR